MRLPLWVKLLVLAGVVLLAGAEGRSQVRADWARENAQRAAAALAEAHANAKESQRRLDRQQENQRAQDALLAQARADAERNRADADRVREQSASAARQWSARLADSPSAGDLEAAAAAIAVLTDVRSRLDAAATELASYATSARAAGLKCAADYDALTPERKP
jgi:hypothetical protein